MRIVLRLSMLALAGTVAPAAATAGSDAAPDPAGVSVALVTERVDARIAPDFRVRADIVTSGATADPFGDPAAAMRHRFASSMIDYYPLGGAGGLRLSAGMRFFSVANFGRDAEWATAGLLYVPRLPGSGTSVRTGFRRHTPATLLGYTGSAGRSVFGVEAGSLLGRANADLPRAFAAVGDRHGGGLNPVANLMFGLRF